MGWRAANSLLMFHTQCKLLAPVTAKKSPASFGLKGDLEHDSTSDHAPHNFPGWGNQIVTAGDIPRAESLYPRQVLNAIRLSRDNRVKYAISEGQMFSSYPTSKYAAWTWRPYAGKDGHFEHGHLSTVGDARADDTRPWKIGTPTGVEDDMDSEDKRMLRNIAEFVGAQLLNKDTVTGIANGPGDAHTSKYPNLLLNLTKDAASAKGKLVVTNAQEVAAALVENTAFCGALAVAIVEEQARRVANG